MKRVQQISIYLGIFILIITYIFVTISVSNFIKSLFWGFEIQSMASFPYYHTAKIRTRPGFGDQTFFFEVDGKDVWVSGDAAPGDLDEKIYWNPSGTIVTFELAGKKMFVYDAESKTEVTK